MRSSTQNRETQNSREFLFSLPPFCLTPFAKRIGALGHKYDEITLSEYDSLVYSRCRKRNGTTEKQHADPINS